MLDNIALLNKQLRWQIINMSKEQHYDQDNLYFLIVELYSIVPRFSIEKQHWERYQIVQTKIESLSALQKLEWV